MFYAISEISETSVNLNKSMEQINREGESNKQFAGNLPDEVSRFKL